MIGYNPASSFAAQLTSRPWYEVVTEPGFLLGRTDPATDPKGKLAAQALDQTATAQNLPTLAQLAQSPRGVYPEETLVGRLQSGQLDAGFFYASEAAAARIRTVSLGPIHLAARYTVTILNRAPHAKAARAFVSFLLGREGRAVLQHDGLTLIVPPGVTGSGFVPTGLRSTLHVR